MNKFSLATFATILFLFLFANSSFGQITTRATLKSYFTTGSKPTQAQYYKVFDSYFHLTEDTLALTALVGVDGTLNTNAALTGATNRNLASTLALKTYIDNATSTGQVLFTITVPTGNATYRIAVDTVGTDSLYINNGYPSTGNWKLLAAGGGGAVSSVYGRTGGVVAASGDYAATQITNTPAGTIAAVNVQTALNELDTEKLADATDAVDADNIAAGAVGASELASTAVTPATYTNTTLTVDADGRITSASSGSGGTITKDSLVQGTVTAQVRRLAGSATTISTPASGEYTLTVAASAEVVNATVFGNSTTLNGSNEFLLRLNNDASNVDRWVNVQMYDQATGALVDPHANGVNWTQTISGNITLLTFPGMNLFGTSGFRLVIN